MLIELHKHAVIVEQQKPVKVHYEGHVVGEYFTDLMVNESVIIELKVAEGIRKEHVAQLTNYLKATGVEVGLLLNFGPAAEFRRIIFTQKRI